MSSSTGDNVVARRAAITKSIDGIKEKKHKILDALKTIKESGEPDMVLMGKLVGAFDSLSAQEDNYTKVLVDIANIHEQATVDVAQDFSDAIDKIKNGGIAKEDKNEVDDENDVIEMNQLAKELAEVQAQAVAASMLNEQLVLKMSQQKNKTAALNEYRKSSSDDVNRRAEEALRDVQNAKIRVTGERQENDRKAKQLERLRKKAVERGIQLGKEEEKQKEELVAQAEQSPIRIPVLNRKNEKAGEQPELSEEERRKEIKNKIKLEKERRDNLHSQIRERLAEMDSRRSRMDTIRQMLSQMSSVDKNDAASNGEAPDSAKELDAVDALEVTFQNAQAKLRNLTAMRERLEQIQADGSDLSVDEQAFIDTLGGEETEEGKETPDEQNPLKEERA